MEALEKMIPWFMYPVVVPFGNPNYDAGLGGAHDTDLGAPANSPVTALLSGTISDISAPTWGKQVCLKLDSPYNGVPYMAYLHLSAFAPGLYIGKHINTGDRVGWVGGAYMASQYLGTSNPTGSNFINTSDMSSRIQAGVALHRGPAYGGAGWETFPPVDWALDPTPIIQQAQRDYLAQIPEAVAFLGRIGIFFGVDTFGWSQAQWDTAAQWCADHAVNFAIIKVFEITQGEWYGGNFGPIFSAFTSRGISVLPYGFLYGGSSLAWEIGMLEKYMGQYGAVCADMEGGPWWNTPAQGQQIANALADKPGLFFGSIPADPSPSSFQPLASRMLAMPMSYSDSLISTTKADMATVGNMPVYPTLDLSQEFGPNNLVSGSQWARQYDQVSLWYYGFATQNSAVFDQVVSIIGSLPPQKGVAMGVPSGWSLSSDGSVLTASNGVEVHTGFKDHVLSKNWNPGNVPQVAESGVPQVLYHASFGNGTVQPFRDSYLWWTPAKGVIEEQELGVEIYLRDQEIAKLQAQVAALEQQVASGISPALQSVINTGYTNLQTVSTELANLEAQVKPYVTGDN